MYHIHGFNQSFNTTKVLYVAEELGVDYTYTGLDPFKGEHKEPAHLKRHPMGKTPTLEHDGKFLFESATICRYLASVEQSDWYPIHNHYQCAVINQWMDFFANHVGRWMGTLLFERVAREKFGMGEKKLDVESEALAFIEQQLACVDEHLSNGKYLAGDTISIADPFAFAYVETHRLSDFSLAPYVHVKAWHDAYQARDAVIRAHARLE